MMTWIHDWVAFLRQTDAMMGVPLVFGGLALMLLGHYLWKFTVVSTFALIGFAMGASWAKTAEDQAWYGLIGALALGLISFPPARQSISVLGGFIGAGVFYFLLKPLNLPEPAPWITTGVAVIAITFICSIHNEQVIAWITSFEGACLLISGLAVLVMRDRTMMAQFSGMTDSSAIVVPFTLLVPTVVGYFLQMADAKRKKHGH